VCIAAAATETIDEARWVLYAAMTRAQHGLQPSSRKPATDRGVGDSLFDWPACTPARRSGDAGDCRSGRRATRT